MTKRKGHVKIRVGVLITTSNIIGTQETLSEDDRSGKGSWSIYLE